MDQAFLEQLNIETIPWIPEEDLFEPAVAERLEKLAQDAEFELEPGRAREFYEAVQALFDGQTGAGAGREDIYRRYAQLMWSLLWKSLPTLSDEDRKKILERNLTFSLRGGIDVRGNISRLLAIYEFGLGPDERKRSAFLHALENNLERLGSVKINIKTQGEAEPLIKNWIRDYNITETVGKVRGSYELLEYINTSENAKHLGGEDKAILRHVLALYDWLKYPSDKLIQKTENRIQNTVRSAQPKDDLYRSTLEELHKMEESYETKEPKRVEHRIQKTEYSRQPTVPSAQPIVPPKNLPRPPLYSAPKQELPHPPIPSPTPPPPEKKPPIITERPKSQKLDLEKEKAEIREALRRAEEMNRGKQKSEDTHWRPFSVNQAIVHGSYDYDDKQHQPKPDLKKREEEK